MPRFVILEHDHPHRHWDFLLEAGEVLRTWRLAEPPQRGRAVTASASFDHRPLYLDYEGPVSGNRGRVVRWDGGTFTWQEQGDDRLVLLLEGGRIHGRGVLQRTAAGEWSLWFDGE
jgi:DNA polymerase Ligase (LigD)